MPYSFAMPDDRQDMRMRPSHPGAFVREEVLSPFGLSITRAASLLGVRRATLSDLINEKAALSPEMALRIEKAFGLDMETMLRMQAWYDTTVMRARTGEFPVERYQPDSR
jgi:addiction module HigA family antidote